MVGAAKMDCAIGVAMVVDCIEWEGRVINCGYRLKSRAQNARLVLDTDVKHSASANKRCAVSHHNIPQIVETGRHFLRDFPESSKTEKNAPRKKKILEKSKNLLWCSCSWFGKMTATVRHLVFIVDTTAAMGPHLPVLRDAYIDPLIRCAPFSTPPKILTN